MLRSFYKNKFVTQIILLNTNELITLNLLSLTKISKFYVNHVHGAGIRSDGQKMGIAKLKTDFSNFIRLLKGIKKFSFDYQPKKE